jgi:hypothetical protein
MHYGSRTGLARDRLPDRPYLRYISSEPKEFKVDDGFHDMVVFGVDVGVTF